MGENSWYLMENSTPRLLGNADNLSDNFDAGVNISLSMAPLTFLVGKRHFLKKLQWRGYCSKLEGKYWSSKKLKNVRMVFYHHYRQSCKVYICKMK
jgi:hypothetical protein